ncbi:MAG TPA: hypothetical protein VLY45_03155 [Nitrospiria bacterium]|nr:hypothetical protein [Nitrospiria bacterium]
MVDPTRPIATRMTRSVIGLGFATFLLVHSGPAYGVDSPALHSPPSGYHQLDGCNRHLGRPYQQNNLTPGGPIELLFYTPGGLTAVLYLLGEEAIRNGQSLTLLADLGPLPVNFVSFRYSQGSPFPRNSPLNGQFQGPYYQLWVYLNVGSTGTIKPC